MKTLILFAYNNRANIFDENLDFFLNFGVFESELCDFCIVVSGISTKSISLKVKNMRILERDNKYGDFGAWGHALENYNITNYGNFIFLNDTCRGPYIQGTCSVDMWPQLFLSGINDQCKLVGPTKNTMFADHIQSYAFGCDKIALDLLIKHKIFSPVLDYPAKKQEFILKHEVEMSQIILKNGYTLKSFFKSHSSCPIILSPWQVMFIKANMSMRFDKSEIQNSLPHSSPQRVQKFQEKKENKLIVARKLLKK